MCMFFAIIIIKITIITNVIIIKNHYYNQWYFFLSCAQNVVLTSGKKMTKLPELGGGGGFFFLANSGNARKKTCILLWCLPLLLHWMECNIWEPNPTCCCSCMGAAPLRFQRPRSADPMGAGCLSNVIQIQIQSQTQIQCDPNPTCFPASPCFHRPCLVLLESVACASSVTNKEQHWEACLKSDWLW